ncbi:replication initiation protein [Acinetobacter pollinis]|uniref:replication initiation protein n=1 Tax=Acinetobacter pollinis TaxID=2605270 RepID=UPI001BB307EC|nr:replication initiation protein [Acinetobacter pollinis]
MEMQKTYPPSWVVMQNSIQECFKSMSIDEKRMLILASPIARTKNATEKDTIIITAESSAQDCEIKNHSAYKSLEQASKALIKRYFCYLDDKGRKTYCNWVIRAKYEDGAVSIHFPEEVLLMLKEFDKLNPYTKYKKDIVLKLKKDYSFDIYHLAKKHQTMGQFEISLEHLKNELGLPPSYDKLCNLKDRVIKPSLNEITANTDINLSYENVKKGRSVVGFRFIVKEKPKPKNIEITRDQNTIDMFCNLTDNQIKTYSSILSKVHSISDLAGNKDYSAFAIWIANILRDPQSVREETAKRIFKALRTETDFNKK